MKKNLISIVILALLVVNIVLTSIMMFSVTSTNKKTAALVTDIASAISLDLGSKVEIAGPSVPIDETESYTLSEMQIPLRKGEDDTTTHFAILTVTLLSNTKHKDYKTYGGEKLASREDMIKGQINEAVGQYTIEDINADPQLVKNEILNRVQSLFESDFIFDALVQALYQ